MSFNLMKLKKNSLSPIETFFVIALMDAQIVSLATTLSSKDALASRWYVRLTVVCEIVAWLSIAVLGHGLKNLESYTQGSICCIPSTTDVKLYSGKTIPLFSLEEGRHCDFAMHLATSFPYYWYSHGVDLVHTLWLAYQHTGVFDSLEKLNKCHPRQESVNVESANVNIFASIPATAFSNWRSLAIHPLLVMIAVERHLVAVGQTNLAEWQSWGQSLTLVVCVGGLSHWMYVNRGLLTYIFTLGNRGTWPNTGPMLPTNIVRYVAMGVNKPGLVEEDLQLLATGSIGTGEQDSNSVVVDDKPSQPNEVSKVTRRPLATRIKSADITDQYLMEHLNPTKAARRPLSPTLVDGNCVDVAEE